MHPTLLEEVFPGAYAASLTIFDLCLLDLQYWYVVCSDPAFGRAQVGFQHTFHRSGKHVERQHCSSDGSSNSSLGCTFAHPGNLLERNRATGLRQYSLSQYGIFTILCAFIYPLDHAKWV